MKSLKLVAILSLLLISFTGFAQKIKLKKNDVLVDGKTWIKYNECGGWSDECSLLSSNDNELIFMKRINVDGAEPRTQYNPNGTLRYIEVAFLGTDTKFETQESFKDIIEILYKAKVVGDDGKLD